MTRVAPGVKGIVRKDLSLEYLLSSWLVFPAVGKSSTGPTENSIQLRNNINSENILTEMSVSSLLQLVFRISFDYIRLLCIYIYQC